MALAYLQAIRSNYPMNTTDNQINISVQAEYIADQSSPDTDQYVFAYHITIANAGKIPARLMTRHWIITDANEKVQEVHGEGVVGEYPYLRPGEEFTYTSGAVLETAVGSMQGSYQMLSDDGVPFDAQIPAFSLSVPHVLH